MMMREMADDAWPEIRQEEVSPDRWPWPHAARVLGLASIVAWVAIIYAVRLI